jgi:hypothetical protein
MRREGAIPSGGWDFYGTGGRDWVLRFRGGGPGQSRGLAMQDDQGDEIAATRSTSAGGASAIPLFTTSIGAASSTSSSARTART